MTKKLALPQQIPLPILDLSFLQLYSHQIRDGNLAAILGASAFTLFIVMRSFAIVGGKNDGVVKLSISQMQTATGMSRPTITKSLKTLEKEKLITVIEPGGKGTKRYYLIDTFADKRTGSTVATAIYKPTEQSRVRTELQRWSESGESPKHHSITLVQVNQTNNVTININLDVQSGEPESVAPWIQEVVTRMQNTLNGGLVKQIDLLSKEGKEDEPS